MKTIFKGVLMAIVMASFGGCSAISIGENETYCEEHGCDYSDAGFCGSPIKIYKHRHELGRYVADCDCGSEK